MNQEELKQRLIELLNETFAEQYDKRGLLTAPHTAEALIANGVTIRERGEWIPVTERLPKELTHVIVCDEDGTVGEAFCYKEGRFEWTESEEIVFVTHWMPLPEPPEAEKGGAE